MEKKIINVIKRHSLTVIISKHSHIQLNWNESHLCAYFISFFSSILLVFCLSFFSIYLFLFNFFFHKEEQWTLYSVTRLFAGVYMFQWVSQHIFMCVLRCACTFSIGRFELVVTICNAVYNWTREQQNRKKKL